MCINNTGKFDVKSSYPAPPDAKHTPVVNSLGWRLGSKYGGRNSLMPNSSTEYFFGKKKKSNVTLLCKYHKPNENKRTKFIPIHKL